MQLTLRLENDCLHVTTTGTVDTVEKMQHYAVTILEKAIEYNTKRVLLDERNLTNLTTSLDASLLAQSAEVDKAAILGIRVANLVSQKGYSIAVIYENALFNRSLNCKTFTDKEQAIQWLTS
nr:hypothetical protein [uncultured Pseudodesulfovibrio sp.]